MAEIFDISSYYKYVYKISVYRGIILHVKFNIMWQDLKNIYHLIQSISANIVYNYPSKGLKVIGVTGTDGKTTTSSMIYHILKTAGYKVALISTVAAIIDGKVFDTGFHVTTPDSFAIQSYIRNAKKAGVKYLIIETTSIGLHQNRVHGINFDIGVLTNITNEHLDYHKTYERLVKAKAILFQIAQTAVINADDKSFSFIAPYVKNKKVISYGLKKDTTVNPAMFPFKINLVGGFNIYNALAAIAAARETGIKDSIIRNALLSFSAPIGREEIVYNKDFKVIIDFAHTPGSFLAVLPEIYKMKTGRLIHVFGCAGQRDKYKRPEMGKISSSFSDVIILTAEDPRKEDVEKIINEIQQGIVEKFDRKNLFSIKDRKDAIFKAISIAKKGDVVLITGKGHEASMNYGNGEEPWSEYEAVREALTKLKIKK